MKILQINAVYGVGSTGKIVRDISDKLIELGHESYVMWATGCRLREEKQEAKLVRIGNIIDHKLHALLRRIDGGQGLHSKLATERACKKILEISPDIVHLHNLHSNYIHLPTLLKFLGDNDIPTLITLHDCWFLGAYCMHYMNHNCDRWKTGCNGCPAVRGYMRKSIAKRFSQRKALYGNMKHLAVNGVSKWTTDSAKQSMLKSAENIELIYNWIDTDVFKPKENILEIKRKYGISDDRKMILGVSQSWYAEKGLDYFVRLADDLRESADIILVGQDNGVPERDNLRCIGFTASVDELVELYSAADVLVNASSVESFALVTLEAMACGTPVVAFDNSGSSEQVNTECGVLAKDGDYQSLLDGVSAVLNNCKERYSSFCRNYICAGFEKNNQLLKYVDFYKRISYI